jgi:hypothetical protein
MALLVFLLAACLVGCGSKLNEAQQREYEGLGARQAEAGRKLAALRSQADALFREVSTLEKSRQAVTREVAVCGTPESGGALDFGPLPLEKRKGWDVRLVPGGKGGGKGCKPMHAEVIR